MLKMVKASLTDFDHMGPLGVWEPEATQLSEIRTIPYFGHSLYLYQKKSR